MIMSKVCRLLAYSTWSQWWGCHLSLWAGWFSLGVSSLSLWRSPFSARQWCWFWSALGILFPQYPPYLVSLPLSATWGGARWETSNSTGDTVQYKDCKISETWLLYCKWISLQKTATLFSQKAIFRPGWCETHQGRCDKTGRDLLLA